jgi:hypothetical protein
MQQSEKQKSVLNIPLSLRIFNSSEYVTRIHGKGFFYRTGMLNGVVSEVSFLQSRPSELCCDLHLPPPINEIGEMLPYTVHTNRAG